MRKKHNIRPGDPFNAVVRKSSRSLSLFGVECAGTKARCCPKVATEIHGYNIETETSIFSGRYFRFEKVEGVK